MTSSLDEKLGPTPTDIPLSPRIQHSPAAHPRFSHVSSLPGPSSARSRYVRPRGLLIWNLFKQWLPVLAYAATSLGFVLAIAFWKNEVLDGLDQLARWLRSDEYFGYAVLFGLIFITTFPPLPLYSTLITLAGYTYGPWIGAVISYIAALSGAIVVFSLSRTFLRQPIARWLQYSRGLCRAVRAIERRPQLLFLVRLAPYPYNVLNMLLAGTPTLEIKTIGAGIRSFSSKKEHGLAHEGEDGWSKVWTVAGIMLCVVLFLYLSWIARRAVDDELGDETDMPTGAEEEERVAFLGGEEGPAEEEAELHPYGRAPSASRMSEAAHEPVSSGGLIAV
ncbi:hypothetical protein F5I97DRAFT_926768 [Phlebopus sp. FC_14]|nr:hypothetical protein F5I97DRAFT_926768 [Phlebopus sp. FC_14]